MEDVKLLSKGTFNTNAKPLAFGYSYMNDKVKHDMLVDTTGGHAAVSNTTYRAAPWLILGSTEKYKSILDPLNNITWSVGAAGHFDKALQYGVLLDADSPTLADTSLKAATLYFNHASGPKTVGAEMKFDMAKNGFDCKLGMAFKQEDHLWKFRLHDSGVARAALQWQLHKVCKATVDTTVNVKDALGGSITSLPVGLSFELKY